MSVWSDFALDRADPVEPDELADAKDYAAGLEIALTAAREQLALAEGAVVRLETERGALLAALHAASVDMSPSSVLAVNAILGAIGAPTVPAKTPDLNPNPAEARQPLSDFADRSGPVKPGKEAA